MYKRQVLASAFLAGAYIAFGALGSVGAAYNLLANPDTYGLGKMVAGLMFPAGPVSYTHLDVYKRQEIYQNISPFYLFLLTT